MTAIKSNVLKHSKPVQIVLKVCLKSSNYDENNTLRNYKLITLLYRVGRKSESKFISF